MLCNDDSLLNLHSPSTFCIHVSLVHNTTATDPMGVKRKKVDLAINQCWPITRIVFVVVGKI